MENVGKETLPGGSNIGPEGSAENHAPLFRRSVSDVFVDRLSLTPVVNLSRM